MHVPIANQQLDATRLLAGQSFSLSTAQIAPSCWSLLWWIKREYVGYTLSISFSKYCSLEVMSFTLNSICNIITKINIQMTNQRKTNTSCDSLRKGLTETTVAQFYCHSLKLKFTWTASNILFLPNKNQNMVSTHDTDHPQCSSYAIHSSEMWCCQLVSSSWRFKWLQFLHFQLCRRQRSWALTPMNQRHRVTSHKN